MKKALLLLAMTLFGVSMASAEAWKTETNTTAKEWKLNMPEMKPELSYAEKHTLKKNVSSWVLGASFAVSF